MTSRGLQRWWPRAKRQRWPRSRRFAPRSTARSATPPPDSVCSWQVLRRDLPALKLFLCHLHDYGPAFAFAALREPRGQAFGKALGRKSKTRFDLAFADRKRVVKVRGVGEIAHAELIEPIERAGAALAANHNIHFEFLGVHAAIITSRPFPLRAFRKRAGA